MNLKNTFPLHAADLRAGGVHMEGVFFSMNSEPWICDVCKRDIPDGSGRVKKEKTKATFERLFKIKCNNLCAACCTKMKALSKKRPAGMLFASVEKDIKAIGCGFLPADSIPKLLEMESWIEETSITIKRHIAQVERENRTLNMLRRYNADLSRAVGDHLWKTYAERRKRANCVISKVELRYTIFSRDGWKCVKCLRTDKLSVDHIVPVAENGSDELDNLQTLCRSCNSSKGSSLCQRGEGRF